MTLAGLVGAQVGSRYVSTMVIQKRRCIHRSLSDWFLIIDLVGFKTALCR